MAQQESITVGYLPIQQKVMGKTVYHKFLIYTDKDGNQWAARGGPTRQKHCRVGFQPTVKPQGFDCRYFRQPEKVIKPCGQQVAHHTQVVVFVIEKHFRQPEK